MKKNIFATLGIVGIAAAALAGCNFGSTNSNSLSRPSEAGRYTGLGSVEAIYGVGAVTTAKLLSETPAAAAKLAALADLADPNPDAGTDTNPDAGTTDPGTTDPGTTDPADPNAGGVTDPGTTDPGTTDPGTTDPNPDPGTTDPNPDPGTEPDYGLPESGETTDKAQQQAENFNRYFNMLDDFLDKASVKTVVSKNPITEGELAAYSFKLEITGADEQGKAVTRVMYYSETETQNRTDYDFDDDEDEREEETFKGYALEGVLEMGTDGAGNPVYYYMTGARSETTEKDGNETETSSELWIRASAVKGDTRNCVMMKQESETEEEGNSSEVENSYTYSVYEEGRLVESTEVSFEQEGAEAEYELEFLSGGSRGFYEIERVERAGVKWISVKYSIDGARGNFVILENADGSYTYKFSSDNSDDRNFANFDD